MRVLYVPVNERVWTQHFIQNGAGFRGSQYQRGGGLGSFFRSIFRAILPVAKTAGKAIGKKALKAGADIASDLVAGRNFKDSLENHGRRATSELLKNASENLQGAGLGKRRKPAAKRSIKGVPKPKRATRKKKQVDQLGVYYK
jgi:hypothetical protein